MRGASLPTPLDHFRLLGTTPFGWRATTVPAATPISEAGTGRSWHFERGTDAADRLDGTSRNDYFRGESGDDHLDGKEGADRLFGGDGRDTLLGGGGDDFLFGNGWGDRLVGGKGNDILLGGYGADRLDGGAGDDRLHGGNGTDRLDGGDGGDVLLGEGEGDRLFGGKGDDVLVGGAGTDTMAGGSGADTFAWFRGDAEGLSYADIMNPVTSAEGEATYSGVPNAANWIPWQIGEGGAIAWNGDGTVRLSGIDGADGSAPNGDYSAGIALKWDPMRGPSSALGDELSTFGSLKGVGYDWFRAEASVDGEAEAPALRLHLDADGDLATADEVILVYEPWWNTGEFAVEDAWQSVKLMGHDLKDAVFWGIEESAGLDAVRDRTLAQWLDGEASPGFTPLSKASLVTGIDLTAGDGWFGDFAGAVDNAFLRFGSADTAFDFERPQPDVITDFESGVDALDLTDLIDPLNGDVLADLLQVEALADGSTLVGMAPHPGGTAFQPLVLLEGSGFDLATDLILPNPISMPPETLA
ncbi:MAG: type I secretion C-terminal target domain-containing protein [Geminicoccaceae bacterium]|nr:type I secretion C-terminal target domain-containing protein [Geminicoccaceae bacterium]